MVVTVRELPARSGTDADSVSDKRRSRKYTITGTEAVNEMLQYLGATAPPFVDGMPIRAFDWEELGGGVWEAEAFYANRDTSETDSEFLEFDTSGGTGHITQSLETVAAYGWAQDFQGAIGVTSDSVEGCDIVIPVFSFTKRKFMRASRVTNAYVNQLFALTGRTNNSSFMMFDEGEVLFMGAQGAKRGYEDWEIAFKFAASPNVSDITIGAMTGIVKGGWEYLWVRYTEQQNASRVVKVPESVYIERVYRSGNFGSLGVFG